MTTKASACNHGQAAIGDIINFAGFSGGIIIQNLHINTAPKAADDVPGGLVAYFGLTDWWLSNLFEHERGAIEDTIGADVTRSPITITTQTAPAWLRSVALRIGGAHARLASKLRAKATAIATGIEIDDYWQHQLDTVRRHWACLNFESAREELQDIGYRMREENALPEAKAAYSELLVDLMHADPYYTEVLAFVLPIIKMRPGVIQSVLAKGRPDFDIERFRRAMYYGEIIGDLRRVKRGNSYGLFEA